MSTLMKCRLKLAKKQRVDIAQVCKELEIEALQHSLTFEQNKRLLELLYKYEQLWSTGEMPLQRT